MIYITCLSRVFDSLRLESEEERKEELASIAKTLVIYSRSAAAKYLNGIERHLNQLYCSALYYLAGFPATATFLSNYRDIDDIDNVLEEEIFLLEFLRRNIKATNPLLKIFYEILNSNNIDNFKKLTDRLYVSLNEGLQDNPRKFIASKLALSCIIRFNKFNIWDILKNNAANYSVELWKPFLKNSNTSYQIWELLPSQLVAVEVGILNDVSDTFSLQMPTSSGKTSFCELLIFNEVKACKKRVLFLVPFRALASEIRESISSHLKAAGINVIASYGGNIPTNTETDTIIDADVLIVTPEKFIAIMQIIPGIENHYQTIICDEGHLIDDDNRGLQYELLLTKLKGTEEKKRKIVFMSAILPNVNEIHEWLGGYPEHLASSDYKPVETDYAFLIEQTNDKSWQLDVNPTHFYPKRYFLQRFIVQNDFRYINLETRKHKLIENWDTYISLACAASLKARKNGSVALFTTTRGKYGIYGLAQKFIALFKSETLVSKDSPNNSDSLPILKEYIEFIFGPDYLLSKLLNYGIGFHHGKLPQEVRREMEEGIQKGTITLIICTNTLAEGVNLPIRTLVVHTIKRSYKDRVEYLKKRDIKNLIGRVGRAGKETRGRVIFINSNERDIIEKVLKDENMERAEGALFGLVKAINNYINRKNLTLSNEIFEQQEPWFLLLIDSIDFALLNLLPDNISEDEIPHQIEKLINLTLAQRYCNTDQLNNCIKDIFLLRAKNLKEKISIENWPIIRKCGVAPRFWSFFEDSKLQYDPIWVNLTNSLDDQWLNDIIKELLMFKDLEFNDKDLILKIINGWMSGKTYKEIAYDCSVEIDNVLELLCKDIGFKLHDIISKLTQISIEVFGDEISEISRTWPSLMQYGLGSMQQLDIFEHGGTDRLAVWGISRFLERNKIEYRKKELFSYLFRKKEDIIIALDKDIRVPQLCIERIINEIFNK